MSKQKISQKKEIMYNIVNSLLAGFLVFLGACTSGGITGKGIFTAVITALVVAVTQFKNYWDSEKPEYSAKLFMLIK
jgi:hypothetical protein